MRSRTALGVALTLVVLGALVPDAEALPLPVGVWTIFANGVQGLLVVTAVDGAGNLTATAFGNVTTGFYSSASNSIVFLRQAGGALNTVQPYAGNLFTVPKGPGVCTYVLTGTFSAYSGTGGTAADNTFGWVAIIDGAC